MITMYSEGFSEPFIVGLDEVKAALEMWRMEYIPKDRILHGR